MCVDIKTRRFRLRGVQLLVVRGLVSAVGLVQVKQRFAQPDVLLVDIRSAQVCPGLH